MRRDNDNSWLDPLLSRQVHHEPAAFDFQRWSREHPEEAGLLERGFETPGRGCTTATHPVWRFIMESQVTKYSAAAVVALAAFVLLSLFWTSDQGVALAAVQEKVAQISTMILRGEKAFTCVADPNVAFRFDVIKYISRQHGFTEEARIGEALVYHIAFNKPRQQCVILLPLWKKGLNFPWTDEQIQIMEKLSPTSVVDLLLQTEHKKLGTATLDGKEVEGFEYQDIKPVQDILPKGLFNIQQGKGTVWIATKELVPVRMEGDILIGKSVTTLLMDWRLHETSTLDSYDVELDPKLFNTDMPEGYTQLTLSDINSIKQMVPGLH
jgi:hypothetical protein